MPVPDPAQPVTAQDTPAMPHPPIHRRLQRRLVAWTAAGCILLLLGSTAAYLWDHRQHILIEAGQLAAQRTDRLAEDLHQALGVAKTVIRSVDERIGTASSQPFEAPPARLASDHADMLAALPLPFDLYAIGPLGREIPLVGAAVPDVPDMHPAMTQLPADHWTVGDTEGPAGQRVLPLGWRAVPNLQGIASYGVDLDFEALQRWLERERRAPDDRASLFRLNPDGTATLLARSPLVERDLGQRVTADWVDPAKAQTSGTVDLYSQLDGQHRRVAYRRLDAPANDLVVVYGAATSNALSTWSTQMPWLAGLALLLAGGMAAGGWRLDRSLRELTDSERKFQLALASGNVWDWDIRAGTVRYAPSFLASMGHASVPPDLQANTLFELMVPEDATRLRAMLRDHLLHRKPYATSFRLRDREGRLRWFDTQGQAFWDADGRATYMAGTTFEVTQRRELEESQRQSLHKLDTVANASPVLFWTSDLQEQRDWVNDRWLDFTGQTFEQAMGEGWMAAIHPDDLELRKTARPPDPQEPGPCAMEYRLCHRDGSVRWVVEQCLPRFDADQRPLGHIGSCVDVTDLRQAEAAARQRGAMLERVFDVLHDMLFVVDADGRIVYHHAAQDARLYAPPDAFLGRTIDEVMPPGHARLVHQEMKLALGGALRDFNYHLDLPDGRHQFNARVARLPESDHCMFLVRDITERETLKQERERLQLFLMLQLRLASRFINQPLDGIDAEIDRALGEIGAFVGVDRAYIFEYRSDEGIAVNTHEWCAPGIDSVRHELQQLPIADMVEWDPHQLGLPFTVDDTTVFEAGPTRTMLEAQGVQSMATLPMNTPEACIGFVGFDSVRSARRYDRDETSLLHLFAQMLVNVRERRLAEAQVRSLTGELEQRVKERTRQLDTSVRRLSQANRELESFAYSVSHDLKSPLRSMEGFASLLLEDHGEAMDPQARDYLDRIQSATRHMARLINDLLAYAHIEQFEQGLVRLPLEAVVTEVLLGMRNELDAQSTHATVEIGHGLAVLAHPQGLAMVLRNLIDNAIKFTRPGEAPDITVRGLSLGPLVRISVTDRGQGFDMRYHDRIFAIFQRLQRSGQTPGTGIGLAMVQKAVERMDGRIWAESAPGEGATFHVELPAA